MTIAKSFRFYSATRSLIAALCLSGASTIGHADTPNPVEALRPKVETLASDIYPQLDALYKDIHAHPELSFQEVRTAARLAAEMRALGFQVTEKVGRTGIVAIYKNGVGPTIMVRTELDALPMEEKTGLPYASKVQTQWNGRDTYVAHSCGHDLHMAAWVGTARTLVALKDKWQGTLMFLGQPAEEWGGGAQAMVDDGLFTRFPKPDLAFALHAAPAPYGLIINYRGTVTSNADALKITFKGRGGHGASPDKTIDPITIAARFIVDVQTVISREKDPGEFGVISIGNIQGGSAGNIIPDSVTLRGTIRSHTPAVRSKLLDGVRRTARAAAIMSGAPEPDITFPGSATAVINDEELATKTEEVLKTITGVRVIRQSAFNGSEDFSIFVNEGIPSMYFVVGVMDPKNTVPGGQPPPSNHSPFFAPVPEPSIKISVQAMSLAVLNGLLTHKPGSEKSASQREIDLMLEKLAAAWARKDMEEVLSFYHPRYGSSNAKDLATVRYILTVKMVPVTKRLEWKMKILREEGQIAFVKGAIHTDVGDLPVNSQFIKEGNRWFILGDNPQPSTQ